MTFLGTFHRTDLNVLCVRSSTGGVTCDFCDFGEPYVNTYVTGTVTNVSVKSRWTRVTSMYA